MNSPIKFGTDGWRGIIAKDFTFENVRICAQGIAAYLKQAKLAERGIVIGYDTRFASEDFAAAAAETLAGNGITVYLSNKVAPTPEISYGVIAQKAGGAIIITASHNPPQYNGLKVKSENASSASSEIISAIEKNISQITSVRDVKQITLAEGLDKKLVRYLDLTPAYFSQLSQLIDLNALKKSHIKIVADYMFGAGAGYFKKLLEGGDIAIIEINDERNPSFPGISPEPIARNLKKLSARVLADGASIGLATDGDSDRIGIIDEKGNFLTQLQVFALLALYLLEIRGERGAIVKTNTATSMLYKLGEIFHVPVIETPVGFKYVAPVMLAENALIGGEESGGYGFRNHIPERDAILAGLYFLDFMVKTGKTPSQLLEYLFSKVGPHYYNRRDVKFPENQRQNIFERVQNNTATSIEGIKIAKTDTLDGFRFSLADGSWLLIRFSGTEPLLRIYAESNTLPKVEGLLDFGKSLTGV